MQRCVQFVFDDPVYASDGYQFRVQLGCENARAGIASRSRHGFAAQRPVYMNITVGNDFGSLADHANNDKIGIACLDALA